MDHDEEDRLLRSVAIQNANSILLARQRAEQALEHSLSLMRATLESSTDAILVTDDEARVTAFNEKFLHMWQLPAEVMESKEHRQIQAAIGCQFNESLRFIDRVESIYETSPSESYDLLEPVDGRSIERFSKKQVINGRIVGRVWSFRDITDRKRAEEALRDETRILELLNKTGATLSSTLELGALLQAVTDAATELIGARFGAFYCNTADNPRGAFVLSAVSGISREAFERSGDPAVTADLLTIPVISRFGEPIGRLLFGRPDGVPFTDRTERILAGVAAQAAVAIDNARLYEAAQNAAEERKRLLENERRTSAMKDEFLATLSHELRTPLSAILGWSQVLRRGVANEEDLKKGLETIERNARSQIQLIEDLLDMSRITAGKIRLDVQQMEPVPVIEAAIETVRPAAAAKGIRIEKLLDSGTGPISGDPNRLQQVVWNLLSNAIKFTPKDGKVQVVLQRVNSHIEIIVADTGIGISPEFLPHVFERFRQADASTTRTYCGLGLGLSIVKSLVELHGGTVQAESMGDGTGTTFSVHLPLKVVHSAASSSERVHPKGPASGDMRFERSNLVGLRVLVVDDEPDARDLIRRVLEECGAEVLTAANAIDALAMLEKGRPDLVVSDIGMPGIDGYEFLRRVRALGQARGGRVPAIALTAFARSEDRTRALRAGYLVHVAKPVEPSELVATVASIAGRTGAG